MHLYLRSIVFSIVWLLAYTSDSPSDAVDFQPEIKDEETEISPAETPAHGIEVYTRVANKTAAEDLQNCSQVQDGNSVSHLVCPNVKAFHRYLRQGENKDVNVEIDMVDGDFSLPEQYASGQLESLIIRNASLTSFFNNSSDTQALRSLKKLDLSGNPDFDVQSLVNLGELNSLTHLSMNGSAIETIDDQLSSLLSNLPKLEYLDLSYSGISYLDDPSIFDENLELKHLNIAGNNKLSVVTFHIDVIQRLNYLNMSNCILRSIKVQEDQVRSINPLPHYSEKDTGILQVLDVSSNRLKEIPSLLLQALHNKCFLFNISNNAFGGASENCQTYHLWNFTQIQHLDSSSCPEQFVGVVGKEELQFKEKVALRKCNWNSCPSGCQCDSKKKEVDCTNLGLKSIPVVGPSRAEVLLLQNNSLENLKGIESPTWCNLKVLKVGFNNISHIFPSPSASSPKIQGSCKCESKQTNHEVFPSCLPQLLGKLHLNNNNLRNYTKNDCNLFHPLDELDLSGNKMETLAPVCGGPLSHLQTLNLSQNNIRFISMEDISQYPRLKNLFIPKYTERPSEDSLLTLFPFGLEVIPTPTEGSPKSIDNEGKTSHNEDQPQGAPDMKASNNDSGNDSSNESSHETEARNQESGNTGVSTPFPASSTTEVDSATDEEDDNKSGKGEWFMTLTACVILFFICLLTCYTNYWRNLIRNLKKKFATSPTIVARRKYDCFVVCSSRDFTQVRETVIVPLTQRGYSIAWHDNAFVPGEWIMQNVERAVQNSSRMLVFATKNLISSRWGLHEIRRGRHEEFTNPDFKIVALVTKTLPKKLHRDLYELVCLRRHIKLTDMDYVEQTCRFLPPLEPLGTRNIPSDGVYMTMNDISDLLNRYEEIRRMERQTSTVRLAELFHTHRENDRVSIRVDIATVFTNHVCDDKTTCSTCIRDRSAMIERFKARTYSTCSISMSETNSLQEYVLDGESGEDITEMLNGDDNSRIRRRLDTW